MAKHHNLQSIYGKNIIHNYKIIVDNVNRAEIIWGTPVPIVKGKMSSIRNPSNTTRITTLTLPIATHHYNKYL